MKYIEIKRRISRHSWWLEEAPMVLQTVFWAWHGFIEQYRYGHPKYLTLGLFFQKGNYGYELTPRDEKEKAFNYLIDRLEKHPEYIKQLHRKWKSWLPQIFRVLNSLERLSQQPFKRKEIYQAYNKFIKTLLRITTSPVIIEHADVYTDRMIFEDVAKELPDLTPERIQEIVFTLTAPTSLSYIDRENRDLLKTARDYQRIKDKIFRNFKQLEKQYPFFAKKFYQLSKEYYWINNNYAQTQVLTPEYFWKRGQVIAQQPKRKIVQDLARLITKPCQIRAQQKRLRKQYRFSRRLDIIFHTLSEFTIWQDERKELVMKISHSIINFCEWLGKETGQPAQYLKMLGLDEMRRFLNKGKLPLKRELESRYKFSVYITERKGQGSKGYVLSGQKSRELFRQVMGRLKSTGDLKGVVASAPKSRINGQVQIILDVTKHKFIPGRILVTTMTRPDLVPYVRQASGIITDEGGVTAHAAIISRELNIPCIIGTRHATRQLKDGDHIEMDLVSGKIIIIK